MVEAIIIGEKYKLSFDKNMMLAIIQPNFSEFDSSDELIEGINGIENISLELGKQLGLKIYLTGNMVNLRDQYISHNINWIFILLIILTTIAIILLYYKLDTLIFGLGIIMEFLWILGLSIILTSSDIAFFSMIVSGFKTRIFSN